MTEVTVFSRSQEYGAHGIKLVPYNDRRRVWYVKCANAQDKEEWERIFRNATNKVRRPVNYFERISVRRDRLDPPSTKMKFWLRLSRAHIAR